MPTAITLQQFNESAGGQVVFHLHVHVIPRHEARPMKPPASIKEEPAAAVRSGAEARGGAEGVKRHGVAHRMRCTAT